MKKPDDLIRVRHMLDAAGEAQTFLGEATFDEFRENRQLAHAIMRTLEIVGEAASQTTRQFRSRHPEIEWRVVVGMRNRLIHAYFDINHRMVWETVRDDIPLLIQRLRTVLEQENG